MLSLLIVFLIIYIHPPQRIDGLNISPGVPVPHAEELEELLMKYLGNSTYFQNHSIFNYLLGNYNNLNDSDISEASNMLDVSVLEPNTIKQLVQIARRTYQDTKDRHLPNEPNYDALSYVNQQRHNVTKNSTIVAENKNESRRYLTYYYNQEYVQTAFDMMKQSIYETRRRMQDTRAIRKSNKDDLRYNIGILYGSLVQLRIKIENAYTTLRRLPYWAKFLFYMMLYEKCLSLHVDITNIVQRIFDFHGRWQTLFKAEESEEEDEDDKDYGAHAPLPEGPGSYLQQPGAQGGQPYPEGQSFPGGQPQPGEQHFPEQKQHPGPNFPGAPASPEGKFYPGPPPIPHP